MLGGGGERQWLYAMWGCVWLRAHMEWLLHRVVGGGSGRVCELSLGLPPVAGWLAGNSS